jgi:hypothetical protein
LSSEDEELVEAELNELISNEHQKAMDKLPIVPLDNSPFNAPGNTLKVSKFIIILSNTEVYFYDTEIKEEQKSPPKKIALEAQ